MPTCEHDEVPPGQRVPVLVLDGLQQLARLAAAAAA
jgi:hypothetical protein